METCELSCVKYALFAFNVVFAISGAIMVAVGASTYNDLGKIEDFMEIKISLPPIVYIVVGSIIITVATFGLGAAILQNRIMLFIFSVLLFILFVLQLALGIAMILALRNLVEELSRKLDTSPTKYTTNEQKRTWDSVQESLKCCGARGPEDWSKMDKTPPSCCDKEVKEACTTTDAYEHGCLEKLEDLLSDSGLLLGGIGIGLAFVKIVGIILACCLAAAIKTERQAH